jgi:hypothetical protein
LGGEGGATAAYTLFGRYIAKGKEINLLADRERTGEEKRRRKVREERRER